MPHGAAIAPLEEEEEGKAKTGAELAKRECADSPAAAESDSRSGGKSYDLLLLLLFLYVVALSRENGCVGRGEGVCAGPGLLMKLLEALLSCRRRPRCWHCGAVCSMRICVARPTGFTGNVSLVGDDDEMASRLGICLFRCCTFDSMP